MPKTNQRYHETERMAQLKNRILRRYNFIQKFQIVKETDRKATLLPNMQKNPTS